MPFSFRNSFCPSVAVTCSFVSSVLCLCPSVFQNSFCLFAVAVSSSLVSSVLRLCLHSWLRLGFLCFFLCLCPSGFKIVFAPSRLRLLVPSCPSSGVQLVVARAWLPVRCCCQVSLQPFVLCLCHTVFKNSFCLFAAAVSCSLVSFAFFLQFFK